MIDVRNFRNHLPSAWPKDDLIELTRYAQQRGRDSSGLLFFQDDAYHVHRADFRISRLLAESRPYDTDFVMGHSRLITNGLNDNQPVLRDDICVLHNGIVVNHEAIWEKIGKTRAAADRHRGDPRDRRGASRERRRGRGYSGSGAGPVQGRRRLRLGDAAPRQAMPLLQQRQPLRRPEGRRDLFRLRSLSPDSWSVAPTSSRSRRKAGFSTSPRPTPPRHLR